MCHRFTATCSYVNSSLVLSAYVDQRKFIKFHFQHYTTNFIYVNSSQLSLHQLFDPLLAFFFSTEVFLLLFVPGFRKILFSAIPTGITSFSNKVYRIQRIWTLLSFLSVYCKLLSFKLSLKHSSHSTLEFSTVSCVYFALFALINTIMNASIRNPKNSANIKPIFRLKLS